MKQVMLSLVVLITAVSLAPAAATAEPSDPGAIAPFVNEYTLAVARLDVAVIDLDALDRWLVEVVSPEDRQAMTEELAITAQQARSWVKEFKQAGGKVIWLLFTIEPLPHGSPIIAVAPLAGGADVKSLMKLSDEIAPRTQVLQVHDALVTTFGREGPQWVKALRPEPRPELASALLAAGNGQFQIAMIPSDDARKIVESMAPTLPDGQSGAVLARGLEWAATTMRLPPGLSLEAIVQTPDEKSAKDVQLAIKSVSQAFRRPLGAGEYPVLRRLVNATADITSGMQIRGNRLVIDLDSKQATSFAAHVFGGLWTAHEQELGDRVTANLMQLLRGWTMYANNHEGRVPDAFAELLKDQEMSPQVLLNPRHPGEKVGFVYVKPPEGIHAPVDRMVMYEKFSKSDGGINVGFADGHVEIASEKQFEELLNAAKNAKPKTSQK